MSGEVQCRYMAAAYPTLTAEDTCTDHRHDDATFALARAFAVACQSPEPSDEQVGWMLADAAAVVDDFVPTPSTWTVTEPQEAHETGLDFTLTINGAAYVVQPGEWEPSHPVSRAQWDAWQDDDCGEHEWLDRPESDTRVCELCGAER